MTAPDLEVVRLQAATYEAGALGMHASPSLFGGEKAIVVLDLDEAPDELQDDLLAFLAAPEPDVTLVVTHKSGQRGKKVLDTLKKGAGPGHRGAGHQVRPRQDRLRHARVPAGPGAGPPPRPSAP